MAELPQWLQALLAVGLCIGLAFWVQFKSVSSLAPALLALPVALLGLSYLSLNGLPVFLDLHLAAGLGLIFLAVLRFWNTLRRAHWCTPPSPLTPGLAIWPWMRSDAWLDGDLDRLIDVVEQHAPDCRLVVCDASVTWPGTLRWPELARGMALVGPMASLQVARLAMAPDVRRLASRAGEPTLLNGSADRDSLVQRIYVAWSALQMTNAR
jgi:hypothetical protein